MYRDFSVIRIIENTLNYADRRLVSHGRRVAYLTYRALKRQGAYSPERLAQIVLVALLHDIGAFKTEEVDNLLRFDTTHVWGHAVYGSLFIKYFSPLAELSPVVLFHHANCREIQLAPPEWRDAAQAVFIADRFDILSQLGGRLTDEQFIGHFKQDDEEIFSPKLLEYFFPPNWRNLFLEAEEDAEFNEILYNTELSRENILAYVKMIVLAIDFRSQQTVTHTFASSSVSVSLAECLEFSPEDCENIYLGAMMHDLGKMDVPVSILEKAGKLDADEMSRMREHAAITEKILRGNVCDEVMQLAVRHHEKLDGSGYPYGLLAADLSPAQRLIAVADIMSALCNARSYKEAWPREKVADVMGGMARDGLIDGSMVDAAMRNYDRILASVRRNTAPITDVYRVIRDENRALLERFDLPAGRARTAFIAAKDS
ncbi:MAG: HD domain-containing protein [Deltaproteobacteria bacterium]|jgi:HD-GYP domain-containing protein (c-di-GMP phosphodiesterase class II)|nr:HD domain-containing protein [Deltaproteobacteria bacterium]